MNHLTRFDLLTLVLSWQCSFYLRNWERGELMVELEVTRMVGKYTKTIQDVTGYCGFVGVSEAGYKRS